MDSQRFIIGLDQFGYKLMNDVQAFIRDTGQPYTREVVTTIYQQAVSQSFSKLTPNVQDFMLRMMEVPDWRTIDYADGTVNTAPYQTFASAIHAFAACLHYHMDSKRLLHGNVMYYVESCTENLAIVKTYPEAATV